MNEKVNYFKRELMNYIYYKNALTEIELKLQMIAKEISSVSSPNLTEPIIENKTYRSPVNKFEILEEEQRYIKRREEIQKLIKPLDNFLESLSDDIKAVVIDVYMLKSQESNKNKTYLQYAKKLNYSVSGLKKIINKKIVKYIKANNII